MARTKAAATKSDLDFHASGLLVKGQGTWTDAALAQFRHFLKLRGIEPTESELQEALGHAKRDYFTGGNHLYLCAAQPCCTMARYDTSAGALEKLSG